MRLIDADATIKEIKARNPDDVSYEDAWAITCIEHAPTIEPERKNGNWVRCDTDGFRIMRKCSECGAMIDIREEFRSFFCYHCGADMRKENR